MRPIKHAYLIEPIHGGFLLERGIRPVELAEEVGNIKLTV